MVAFFAIIHLSFLFHDEGQFVDIRLTAMECLVDYVRVEGSESDLSHLLALIEGLWKNGLWRVQKDYLHLQISPIDLDFMSVQAVLLNFRCFDFCDFWFNAVYNAILYSFPLVLLSSLDLGSFCFLRFFMSPHINSVNPKCLYFVKRQDFITKIFFGLDS